MLEGDNNYDPAFTIELVGRGNIIINEPEVIFEKIHIYLKGEGLVDVAADKIDMLEASLAGIGEISITANKIMYAKLENIGKGTIFVNGNVYKVRENENVNGNIVILNDKKEDKSGGLFDKLFKFFT